MGLARMRDLIMGNPRATALKQARDRIKELNVELNELRGTLTTRVEDIEAAQDEIAALNEKIERMQRRGTVKKPVRKTKSA